MKVKLATQVCSQSVANALLHCAKNLKLPEFKGTEPTAEFLKCFDLLFDIMNSRFTFGKHSKAPLSSQNIHFWTSSLTNCEQYILELKHTDGKSVLKGPRKAAFIGWLNDIKCLRIMYENYVATGTLKYLLVFKMSQDPLELFFGSIRASLGYNNNPTVLQFERAYTKLCAGALLKAGKGSNCLWDDSTTVLCARDMRHADNSKEGRLSKSEEPKLTSFTSLDHMVIHPLGNNELRKDILVYIAGNTQRKVTEKIKCDKCLAYFADKDINVSCGLLEMKDRGGLVRPCQDLVTLVRITDNLVEIESKCSDLSSSSFHIKQMCVKCLSYISDMKPFLFRGICDKADHKVEVMK